MSKKLLHVGIFGPSLCGKTSLAKQLAKKYWEKGRIRSIVLDPWMGDWGKGAFVTKSMDEFLRMVATNTKCAVFIEESSETIDRDKTLTHLFTSIRHRGHRVHVIGHTGSSLLPVMREQIQTVYLFRQPKSAADVWAEVLSEPEILKCTELIEYEFLWCQIYQKPVKGKLNFG